MKVIDLTHLIIERMPVFPGTEGPKFEEGNTLEKDGFRESRITMYSHTGTHIDPPGHILPDGLLLHQFPVDHFVGKGAVIDLTASKSPVISREDLLQYGDLINNIDYLLLRTGWDKYWGSPTYFRDYPVLTQEAVIWLTGYKLKGLGVDTISVDRIDAGDFPNHRILLGQGMVIIENLTNLDSLNKQPFIFSCLPLKYREGDGSPLRAVALLE